MILDQYNDGPNVWLYDDSFTELLRDARIPQPGRASSNTVANADEQAAAAAGRALCILTDGDFGGCDLRLTAPDPSEFGPRQAPAIGMLYLPTGQLRIEGPNWLRCDPTNADIAANESESIAIELSPGRYQVAVFRLAEDSEDDELLIALTPWPSTAKAAGNFYLGYPADETPLATTRLTEDAFYGQLEVDGNDYHMRPTAPAREALNISEGSLLRMSVRDRGITAIYTQERYVDPRLYSPEMVALRPQLDGIAIDQFGMRVTPDDPLVIAEGKHAGKLETATLDLHGEAVSHIPLVAGPDSWPDMYEIDGRPAAPGDAFARLEDLLRGCSEWCFGTVIWRDNTPLLAEIAAWPPDAIETSLRNTAGVGPRAEFTHVPQDLLGAFSWLIEQAAGGSTPLSHSFVRIVPRLPIDECELEAVTRAAWRALLGA
jgi:hypothetical protein